MRMSEIFGSECRRAQDAKRDSQAPFRLALGDSLYMPGFAPLRDSDRVRGGRSPVCPQNRAYGSVHGSSRKAYPPIHIEPIR